MTIPQTVMMIAIGTLLIQPVSGKGLWTTFGIAGILVISLILTEYIQFKFDPVERRITAQERIIVSWSGSFNTSSLTFNMEPDTKNILINHGPYGFFMKAFGTIRRVHIFRFGGK